MNICILRGMIIFTDYELAAQGKTIPAYEQFIAERIRAFFTQRWEVLREEIEKEERSNLAFTVINLQKQIPTINYFKFSKPLKLRMHESIKDANLPFVINNIIEDWKRKNH